MRLGSVTVFGISLFLGQLGAQDCAPVARIVPAGALSGTFDSGSCQLVDGTPYVPYRLDLPVRGQIKFDSTGTTDVVLTLRDAAGNKVDSGPGFARAIETGSYTVLISGTKSGQTGDYNVATTFTAEAGMLCANFPNIGRRHVVDGLLPGSGCLAPDGTPYEAYTLTTDGAGSLTVTVDSTDFTPVVAIRSLDGRQLAMQAGGPVTAVLGGDSQYLIVIGSNDKNDQSDKSYKTGAYRVTTTFQSAGNGTCLSQKTFTESGSDSTTIGADSCFITLADSGDQSHFNYYTIALPSPGLVDATAVSGDFNATLNLRDAAGNLLASNTGGGGSDAQFNVSSSLRAQLPAGSYQLYIVSDLPTGGAYSLNYAFTPGNPKPCTPAKLNFGDLLNGAFSADSCRTSIGLSDIYTLTMPASGTVDLDVSTSALKTILVIRDSKDNLMVRNNAGDGLGDSHITADLPAGTYTVVAAASAGSGSYQLAARLAPHDIPGCTYAQSLELNGGYVQRLGPGSCRASNGQPVDYYTFTLSTDALILAVLTSSEIDGFLTLYDASGNVLRTDDNTYGSNDPLIVQYLPAGTYKLGARDASSTSGGLYQVDLRTTVAPRPPFCNAISTLTPGATATGVIAYTGCQYTGDTFADLYQINLAADATLDIRADSSEFDAYLVLLDSKGAVVDEDDDSGGNTNSRINRALAAGTYTIVVKPFGDYTSHGKYTLTTK